MLSLILAGTLAQAQAVIPPEIEAEVRAATGGAEAALGYSAEDLAGWRYCARLPLFDTWIGDVVRFEHVGQLLGQRLAAAGTPSALVEEGWLAGGYEIAEALEVDAVSGSALEALDATLAALWEFAGRDAPVATIETECAKVDAKLVAPLTRFLAAVPGCVDAWALATERIERGDRTVAERALAYFSGGADADMVRLLEHDFDRAWAGRAAVEFTAAVETLADKLGKLRLSAKMADVRLPTPYGDVFLGGGGKSEYGADALLLLVDVSGHDHYLPGSAYAHGEIPLRGVIDLRGDDTYESRGSVTEAGAGAGIGGVGVLVDLRGDDTYLTERFGGGMGLFGAGVLHDVEGNDRYVGEQHCQGVGMCGVGLLLDREGEDHYELFTYGQGLGLPSGAGLLVDLDGDDDYVARDDELRRPSPQTAEHNVSMAQGCGLGWRGEGAERHASGGLGVLLDHAGDDHYRGAVFAQAVGYWYGVGMLFDLAGDDRYEAVYYGQSASAHFALSYLLDVEGNDDYRTTLSQSLGNGRDLSVAVFHDAAGDDRYFAPDRSLGCGDLDGTGLFLDSGGQDRYEFHTAVNCGLANFGGADPGEFRRTLLTLGIFLDLGGERDEYLREGPNNGDRWVTGGRFEGMKGFGLDQGP